MKRGLGVQGGGRTVPTLALLRGCHSNRGVEADKGTLFFGKYQGLYPVPW